MFWTSRKFLRPARARASAGACGPVRQKFFIPFLDELDNFKHFELYFFFGDFWAKNRQFGDLASSSGARLPNWRKIVYLVHNATCRDPIVQ